MYIKIVNDDEQRYESSELWAPWILSLPRLWKPSAHK